MRATFPPLSIVGTPTPTIAPTECVGTLPLYFGVQNRGDTVFRLNSYSAPVVSASPNAHGAA